MGQITQYLNVSVQGVQQQSVIHRPFHYGFLCAEPHHKCVWYLWTPPSALLAWSAAAALQSCPILPTQTMAPQVSPAVPIHAFPLAFWESPKGKKTQSVIG